MSDRPLRVFIESASEGLSVAKALRDALRENADFEAKLWNEDIFKLGETFMP